MVLYIIEFDLSYYMKSFTCYITYTASFKWNDKISSID